MDEQNLETVGGEEGENATEKQEGSADERKLNPVVWIILFVGSAMLDTFQAGLSAITLATLGSLINILIDIFVGLSLAYFFALHHMLDWKLGFSLILGFAAEFFTGGIAPAWLLDILYAFIVTDGKQLAGMAPVIGDTAREAALAVMSRGKSVEKQASLRARTDILKERDKKYMSNSKAFNPNKNKDKENGQLENNEGGEENNASYEV